MVVVQHGALPEYTGIQQDAIEMTKVVIDQCGQLAVHVFAFLFQIKRQHDRLRQPFGFDQIVRIVQCLLGTAQQ